MQLPKNDKTSLAPCLVQMCLGVKQEGKSRTWVCGALPCVTQRGEKNPHRATDSFLLNLSISPVSDDASFPSKTDSIPSDLSILELPIIFCIPVSHFQVLLPSFERLPFCQSLLALFLVVYPAVWSALVGPAPQTFYFFFL